MLRDRKEYIYARRSDVQLSVMTKSDEDGGCDYARIGLFSDTSQHNFDESDAGRLNHHLDLSPVEVRMLCEALLCAISGDELCLSPETRDVLASDPGPI